VGLSRAIALVGDILSFYLKHKNLVLETDKQDPDIEKSMWTLVFSFNLLLESFPPTPIPFLSQASHLRVR
jgi:hypothetical protein